MSRRRARPAARGVRAHRRREIANVEKLVATTKVRSFPFHFWCRQVIESGRASPELLAAAERSRREWDAIRDQVPTWTGQ
jgi:hypothetical protein